MCVYVCVWFGVEQRLQELSFLFLLFLCWFISPLVNLRLCPLQHRRSVRTRTHPSIFTSFKRLLITASVQPINQRTQVFLAVRIVCTNYIQTNSNIPLSIFFLATVTHVARRVSQHPVCYTTLWLFFFSCLSTGLVSFLHTPRSHETTLWKKLASKCQQKIIPADSLQHTIFHFKAIDTGVQDTKTDEQDRRVWAWRVCADRPLPCFTECKDKSTSYRQKRSTSQSILNVATCIFSCIDALENRLHALFLLSLNYMHTNLNLRVWQLCDPGSI